MIANMQRVLENELTSCYNTKLAINSGAVDCNLKQIKYLDKTCSKLLYAFDLSSKILDYDYYSYSAYYLSKYGNPDWIIIEDKSIKYKIWQMIIKCENMKKGKDIKKLFKFISRKLNIYDEPLLAGDYIYLL